MSKLKAILIKLIRSVHHLLSSGSLGKYYRTILFDSAPNDSLIIFNGHPEKFIVSASDKIIGKRTYVEQSPFEFEQLKLLVNMLGSDHKRKVFIDIGANIGTVCISALKRGLFERAIAIEPEPHNFSLLMANIHINKLANNIDAYNIAFGENDNESLSFELSKYNFGDHRVRLNSATGFFDESDREIIEVKSNKFDTTINATDPQSTLIWIDTQGYEGYVLSGANNALSKQVPICLEFWPYGMTRTGCYEHLKNALTKNGYKFYFDFNDPSQKKELSPKALDDLFKELKHPEAFTNLLVL